MYKLIEKEMGVTVWEVYSEKLDRVVFTSTVKNEASAYINKAEILTKKK